MKPQLALLWMSFALTFFGQAPREEAQLMTMLQQLGRQVEIFREQYPSVTCTEGITQVKFGKGNTIVQRQESQSDYLILMTKQDNDLMVEESRVTKKTALKRGDMPLLSTAGFSTLILVFHPLYQDSYEFAQLPEETVDGKRLVPIQFRHVSGTRSTVAFRREAQNLPLELQGTAWVESNTLSIVRIVAELAGPIPSLGLQTLNAEVRYAPVQFAGAKGVYWLPVKASIDIATARQHWRNTHRFADYRRFSASAEGSTRK